MMNLKETFVKLGKEIENYLSIGEFSKYRDLIDIAIEKASQKNPWFQKKFILLSLESIRKNLSPKSLDSWDKYFIGESNPKIIALIMAGNIPLVGFHDFLAVVFSGNIARIKLSSKDDILLPMLTQILIDINSSVKDYVQFETEILKGFDAVIATGSNNSSRYFEYYFQKYPSIIRKNRNSVAIIHEDDDDSVLEKIGQDIGYYFGLGCRSVSKVFLPLGYDIQRLIKAMKNLSYLADNYKYFNNYEFNKSIYLINRVPHFDNGFMLFKEDISLISPVSVVHFEFYKNPENLIKEIGSMKDELQCIVSSKPEFYDNVFPGESQFPEINDWADNKNVRKFLVEL